MRPIDLTRPVVQVRISGILQQACPIVVPAIGYVCITKRFGPGVSKLRVDRFHFRAVKGLECMVVGIATPECIRDEAEIRRTELPNAVAVVERIG